MTTDVAADSAKSPPVDCPASRRPFVVAASVLGSSMAFIDGTAVTLALEPMKADLGAGFGEILWIVNVYTLFLSALILVGGALGDIVGRRGAFSAGVALFTLASGACAAAPTPARLILARAVQGIGAALIAPLSLALISAAYPPETRGRAIGAWAAASALMTAVGPPLGGFLAENASWRYIFLINLPIGAAAVALSMFVTPPTPPAPRPAKIDFAGAGLAVLAMGLVAFGLISAAEGASGPTVWGGALALGAAAFAGLVVAERRASAPMAPPDMFRSRCFVGLNLVTFLVYGAFGGLFVFYPIVLKEAYGCGVDETGLAFLGFAVTMAAGSAVSGALVERWGVRRMIWRGTVLVVAGFWLMGYGPFMGEVAGAALALTVFGAGMAMVAPALSTGIFAVTPQARHGAASGVNNAVARGASLFAVAGYGLVAALAYRAAAGPEVAAAADFASGGDLPRALLPAYTGAVAESFRTLVDVSIGVGVLAALVAAFVLTSETEGGSFRAEFRHRLLAFARQIGVVDHRSRPRVRGDGTGGRG